MTWADDLATFAARNLPSKAREELWARGVSDEQISLFQLGYLNGTPSGPPEHFQEWARTGEKLKSVFVLPLTNTLGAIKGFQFRHVDRTHSGYTDYFVDRREPVLFGLGQAAPHMWATRSAFLVEGAFDLFPIHRVFPSVLPTLTASPNPQTVRVLRRLVNKIWMAYDSDPVGRRGCREFEEDHGHEFEVVEVVYPNVKTASGKPVKDPGELWEALGDDQFIPFIRSVIADDPFR
jgi:DNA primase